MSYFSILFIVLAISLDAFAISLSYGASRLRIPLRSVFVINVIGTCMLAVALFAGSFIGRVIPHPEFLAATILFTLGSLKIFDCLVKNAIKKAQGEKKLTFSAFDFNFILTIYGNPHLADVDKSRHISAKEAVALAIALALDNMAVGLGAGLVANPLPVIGLNLIVGTLAILAGLWIGDKVSSKTGLDISWVGGVVLIVVGTFTLF